MKHKVRIGISLYLIALMAVTLWIRLLPLLNLGDSDVLGIVERTDSLYLLRQVELVSANFPAYGYFDPMTYYPHGQAIGIGPLFIWICSGLCLAVGATTRPEIVQTALVVPPVMAAIMVPVVFLLLRRLWDTTAGLVGAGLVAVIGANYFHVSLAGSFDHHIADVLFGTIFCLSYLYTISYAAEHRDALQHRDTARTLVALSLVSGITYSLGLLSMPTMILFGLLVAVFTAVMLPYDLYHRRDSAYLLVPNLAVFGTAIAVLLINGIQSPGMNLYEYSLGQPVAYLLAAAGTVLLYLLQRAVGGDANRGHLALALGLGLAGLLGLVLLVPELVASLVAGFNIFFGFNPNARIVQETRTWSLAMAWGSFGLGLALAAGGAGIALWRSLKAHRPALVYVLVWSALMVVATWRQARNEYYLAVVIVVLSAICIAWFYAQGRAALVAEPGGARGDSSGPLSSAAPGSVATPAPGRRAVPGLRILLAVLVVAMGGLFVLSSVQWEYGIASGPTGGGVNAGWREALAWLETGTPGTGVDYYTIHDRATFAYPEGSYGIMNWWDRGHMITFLAKRIPTANPFQSGVGESAAFFMADSEEDANLIAESAGARYVVTDIQMAVTGFAGVARTYNASAGLVPYTEPYLLPDQGTLSGTVTFYKKPFFATMLSRLHTFDGSMLRPSTVTEIEYTPPTVSTRGMKVIRSVTSRDGGTAGASGPDRAPQGGRTETVSASHLLPIETVPALQHYRLVHESPGNLSANSTERFIKIFEYVPGARIPAEGVIELSLVSNGGRQFEYRQASTGSGFVVPYSTTGNPYGVRAVGRYRIVGTDREFEVGEDAVRRGLTIGA